MRVAQKTLKQAFSNLPESEQREIAARMGLSAPTKTKRGPKLWKIGCAYNSPECEAHVDPARGACSINSKLHTHGENYVTPKFLPNGRGAKAHTTCEQGLNALALIKALGGVQ
jgi:hypothetical protein